MNASQKLGRLSEICRHFDMSGHVVESANYGSGHINDTFRITVDDNGSERRYILQRVNRRVFKNIPALMENVARVSAHISNKDEAERPQSALTLIPTKTGKSFLWDEDGECWRVYDFIDGAQSHDTVRDPAQAFEAAKAFGQFQQLVADLPPPRLHETIPGFHDTRRRFEALREAIERNASGRASSVVEEIGFARHREPMVDVLLDLHERGEIPERITHNDTKFNNVMLDDATGEAVCVIDFDTAMPGLALYDFGDMVRSASNSAAEDEPDSSKVHAALPIFEALVRGYLHNAHAFLNAVELAHLVMASRLITFEIGIRFLTDFLDGDIYFKTTRPEHNLDRCRSQFALVKSMEDHAGEMEKIVADAVRR